MTPPTEKGRADVTADRAGHWKEVTPGYEVWRPALDPQVVLYERHVVQGQPVDDFSAKLLYPGLSVTEARKRIERLKANRRGGQA